MHTKFSLLKLFAFVFFSLDMWIISGKFISQPPLKINWNTYETNVSDVGIGAEGHMFLIKSDGKIYFLSSKGKGTSLIDVTPMGYKTPLYKVAVDSFGTPFVIDVEGNILYLNTKNKWKRLPGCAKDIGVGINRNVWKIGCDEREGGYGVWKLICTSCKLRNQYLKPSYAHIHSQKSFDYVDSLNKEINCNWHRVEGAGKKIAVDSEGNPWVVRNNNEIYAYDTNNWRLIPGFLAQQISISNEGVLFAIGKNFSIGRLVCFKLGTWQILSGSASDISVGAYSIPFIIDTNSNLQTLIK
jgi:hypothetical protein